MSSLPIIRLGKWRDDSGGVDIGETNLHLSVEYRGPDWWRFKGRDFHPSLDPRTAWISVKKIEDLRVSPKAKPIRDTLEHEYGDKWRQVLERVISIIQDNEETWLPKEEDEETENVEQKKEADVEIKREAEAILSSTDVLGALKPHLNNVVAGENENKQLAFLHLLGGKTLPQMILLKADSGAGKTQLSKLADAFETKTVGRFSAHALDYTDLTNYNVLRLKELGSMDQEFLGVSTIKFLSADDEGYSVEVTVKDEEGRFTTAQYKIPPITVLTTTTQIKVDPQFERRAWILNLDDSKEQTERVRRWKAKLEREKAEVALGLRAETSYQHSLRVLKAVAERVEPVEAIIPFPEALTEVLGTEKLRMRGDYDKFYGVVKLYGRLHQRTLPRIKGVNRREAVLVLPEHAFKALKIAEKPYATMTSELEERSRKLISKMKEANITKAADIIDMDTRAKIAVALGKSETTVKRYFDDWERAGYVNRREGRGRGHPRTYQLLYDLNVIEQKAHVSLDITEMAEDIGLKFIEEATTYLERLKTKVTWGNGYTLQKVLELITITASGYKGISPVSPESFGGRHSGLVPSVSKENNQLSSYNSQTDEDKTVPKDPHSSPIGAFFLTEQETLEVLREKWTKGYAQDFIARMVEVKKCNREEAERLLEKWLDKDGLVAYDQGWLVWVN